MFYMCGDVLHTCVRCVTLVEMCYRYGDVLHVRDVLQV